MSRDADQIAQDYSAMLGSVSVITNCLDDNNEFCSDMTRADKKERVKRSAGYLSFMKDLDDWGSEDMSTITAAITTATNYDPEA
mgnify:CR=1 FL=1